MTTTVSPDREDDQAAETAAEEVNNVDVTTTGPARVTTTTRQPGGVTTTESSHELLCREMMSGSQADVIDDGHHPHRQAEGRHRPAVRQEREGGRQGADGHGR